MNKKCDADRLQKPISFMDGKVIMNDDLLGNDEWNCSKTKRNNTNLLWIIEQ